MFEVDRIGRVLSCTLAAVILTVAPASSHEIDARTEPRALVMLREDAPGTTRDFADLLAAKGGWLSVALSERSAIVRSSDSTLREPGLATWIAGTWRERISTAELRGLSEVGLRDARVWNELLAMRRAPRPALDGEGLTRPNHPDAGPIPVELPPAPRDITRDAPTHIPYGAEYYDTSAYLAGSSAVGVWLLEAAGSTYDWSQAEEDQTLAGVAAGLENWVEYGSTLASLSFFLDVHTDVPVSGVPIENPQSTESTWIGEALQNAGWPGGNAFERCFAYNNSIRDALQTNWCYSMFIVDSDPNVNQGLFSTGGYAWAYYGGPWVYMSRYSTWAYNAANYFEAVPMHETGHIYYSTDEYDGQQQLNGYLNRNDTLSQFVTCIMNQNSLLAVCNPTRNQLAWRDNDADGIMEPLDTEPTCALDEHLPDPTSEITPTWTGRAEVTTIPNLCPYGPYFPQHAITIATIDAVECRVDGGAWIAATPADGLFDAYGEDYAWTSPPLSNGQHLIESRALNSVGLWTTAYGSDTITIEGATDAEVVSFEGRQLTLERLGSNPSRGNDRIRFFIPDRSVVRCDVYSLSGRLVRSMFEETRERGFGEAVWSGDDELGRSVPSGVYFYRLESGSESITAKVTLLR